MSYTKHTRVDMEFIAVNDFTASELTAVEVGHGFAQCERRAANLARTFQLHIIVNGNGSFGDTAIGRGDCFLVRRGDCYRECGEVEQYWINFDGATAESLLDSCGIGNKTRVFQVSSEASELIIGEFESIFSPECELSLIGTKFYMLGCLYKLLSLFADRSEAASQSGQIDRIKTYIMRNLSSELRLESLAAPVGLSPKYLSRLFRERTGQTISEYIENVRLTTAATLLISSDRTIDEVARTVGYRDPLYFSKTFKAKFGKPPSRWR